MTNEQVEDLLKKYAEGACTEKEKLFLEEWFLQWNNNVPAELTTEEISAELDKITDALFPPKVKMIRLWPRVAAAAVLILSIGMAYLFTKNNFRKGKAAAEIALVSPIPNKAYLTLANGKRILLTMSRSGTIAQQPGVAVNKGNSNLVVYITSAGAPPNANLVYNMINTPAGGQFHIVLSDGTGVWLNALSSIRFPVIFSKSERRVEISGEAYFEVKHNADRPFHVIAGKSVIEDIGTSFNINSYTDESLIKTTLLEGSVRVYNNGQNTLLEPGQQSQIKKGLNSSISIINVNTDEVVAWKNGLFKFENTPITEVMKQISRWYGLTVVYQGKVPDKKLSGEIPREMNASNLFELLRFFKVKFTVKQDGNTKKIIIIS